MTGDELFDIVATYAGFGIHHSGTEGDRRTVEWLVDRLSAMDAYGGPHIHEFDRWVGSAELTLSDRDEQTVPVKPLFYSAVGEHDTTDLDVVAVDFAAAGNPHELSLLLADRPHRSAVVISIDGPDDDPIQCNRVPTDLFGRPAVVIAGNWRNRVAAGARLRFGGHTEPAQTSSIAATLGPIDAPRVTLTTPLTGWTPAAGERGTGLAIALAMANDLALDHHVTFLGCSGHELDHLGLRSLLKIWGEDDDPVIHLGASMGAVEHIDRTAQLAKSRMVLTTATGKTRSAIGSRATDANWTLRDLDVWPGEGGTWREAGRSVLSFLGYFSLFHAMGDVAERATTPEAMELAADVAVDAARLFLDAELEATR